MVFSEVETDGMNQIYEGIDCGDWVSEVIFEAVAWVIFAGDFSAG